MVKVLEIDGLERQHSELINRYKKITSNDSWKNCEDEQEFEVEQILSEMEIVNKKIEVIMKV